MAMVVTLYHRFLMMNLLACSILAMTGCSSPVKPSNSYKPISQPTLPESEARKTIVEQAINQIGKDYQPGGVSPREGFDCSGLVFYSYLQAGKLLPRRSEEQYIYAQKIKKPKEGDLIFFSTNPKNKNIDHVGIYLGDELFIHAPGRKKAVSTSKLTEPYWQNRMKGIGSYFE